MTDKRRSANDLLHQRDGGSSGNEVISICREARILARQNDALIEDLVRLATLTDRVNQEQPPPSVLKGAWQEIDAALGEESPALFFEILQASGALRLVIPEVSNLYGVPQTAKHHPEIDSFIHTMMSLERACELTQRRDVRFAVLVHDIGKGRTAKSQYPRHIGHEEEGAKMMSALCCRLGVPPSYQDLATRVARHHLEIHGLLTRKPKSLHKLIHRLSPENDYTVIFCISLCCIADAQGRKGLEHRPYPQAKYLVLAANSVRQAAFIEDSKEMDEVKKGISALKRLNQSLRKQPHLLFCNSAWSYQHGYEASMIEMPQW